MAGLSLASCSRGGGTTGGEQVHGTPGIFYIIFQIFDLVMRFCNKKFCSFLKSYNCTSFLSAPDKTVNDINLRFFSFSPKSETLFSALRLIH